MNCPICFEDLEDKIKASPDICEHVFCLQCIEKWSKLGSFCPVDRKRYKKIINLESESLIQVKPRKRKRIKTFYDFSSKCEVCSEDKRADVLLLCDCCDLAFHLYCLTPPLKKIPAGLWFCPTCATIEEKMKKKNGITKEVEAEMGNAVNHIKDEKRKSSLRKRITTKGKNCNSVKELINKEKRENADAKNNDSIISEQCSNIIETCNNVVSEFQDMNIMNNCNKNIDSCGINLNDSENKIDKICKTFDFNSNRSSFKCSKSTKTYCVKAKKQKEIKRILDEDKSHKAFSVSSKNINTDDMCLNKVSKENNLLDDCLSESVIYGEMKLGIQEDYTKNVCETHLKGFIDDRNEKLLSELNCVSSEENRPYSKSSFGNKICEITPPNSKEFQKHPQDSNMQESCKNVEERLQIDANPVGTFYVDDPSHSCSSTSLESYKDIITSSLKFLKNLEKIKARGFATTMSILKEMS